MKNRDDLRYHLQHWRLKRVLHNSRLEAIGIDNATKEQLEELAQIEVNLFMLETIAELV
jgi:hypothetical protein